AGGVRRRRALVAVDRGAGRRQAQVRLLQPAGGDQSRPGGAAVEEPGAGGAGGSTAERGVGAGPLRGPFLARGPPPRRDGPAGLRLSAAGAAASAGATPPGPKKGGSAPVLTLPGIRRALQRLLLPLAKPDCDYCRSQRLHPIRV